MKEIKHRSDCPISYGLDFFGDKWTLLIVRDIVIYNKNTFGDFLNADEKMATNILSDRLKTLEAEGFLLKYAVPGKGKVAYCLTEKGITLVPIIVELSAWGSAHNENNDSTKREAFAKALKKSKTGLISQLQAKLLKDYHSHLPA
ncbi:winged helix-turn-helix transcriptional regulator [Mucilaginibacter jinjuensis]|uniref:Helix-turn-helix domain-containing protein n=1 Tax=Mucilaginibacter jinjuensis TaxID=1176721 RepID=A0ABY7T353_9SPHI|nr:helix-turn-helix domain-containing protein [Mucilaginibacter jinjuensis]WCT10698.1 helix-turn-helix domain-containing protein [Mucilaginibacter jinjuensis]